MPPPTFRRGFKFKPELADDLLVGGDDCFPGLQRAQNIAAGWLNAAHAFYDNGNGSIRKNVVIVRGKQGSGRKSEMGCALDVANQNMRNAEVERLAMHEIAVILR